MGSPWEEIVTRLECGAGRNNCLSVVEVEGCNNLGKLMGMFKQRTVWPCVLGYMIWDHIVILLRLKGFQLGMQLQVSKERNWALQSQFGFW